MSLAACNRVPSEGSARCGTAAAWRSLARMDQHKPPQRESLAGLVAALVGTLPVGLYLLLIMALGVSSQADIDNRDVSSGEYVAVFVVPVAPRTATGLSQPGRRRRNLLGLRGTAPGRCAVLPIVRSGAGTLARAVRRLRVSAAGRREVVPWVRGRRLGRSAQRTQATPPRDRRLHRRRLRRVRRLRLAGVLPGRPRPGETAG